MISRAGNELLKSEERRKANETQPPRTVASVLLERWAKDTRKMAQVTLEAVYDSEDDVYVFDDGFMTSDHEEALDHEVARLNSPAEVEA